MTFIRVIGLAIALAFVTGCSGGDDRVEVTGSVKLKGQPIKDGAVVMFEPLDGQDTAVNAEINGGKYTVPRKNGLKPGKYLVRVTAGDGKTAVNPVDPDAGPAPGGGGTNIISKELVPSDWNVNSKQQVRVTAGNPNTFDFDIP